MRYVKFIATVSVLATITYLGVATHRQSLECARSERARVNLEQTTADLASKLDALTTRVDQGADLTLSSGVLSLPIVVSRLKEDEAAIARLELNVASPSSSVSEIEVQSLRTRLCDLERQVLGYCRS
jgi:hypothetical protein